MRNRKYYFLYHLDNDVNNTIKNDNKAIITFLFNLDKKLSLNVKKFALSNFILF